jgi:hypothetical protein
MREHILGLNVDRAVVLWHRSKVNVLSPSKLMRLALDLVYIVCRNESNKVSGLHRWLMR